MSSRGLAFRIWVCALAALLSLSCEDKGEVSAEQAKRNVLFLKKAAKTDVSEIRSGLPQGAKHLKSVFESETPAKNNAEQAREALETARSKTQDLRVAKSTFFALVDRDGTVIRNDQEQDLMVGKGLFSHFPELKAALQGKYLETRGSMPEAAGVKGRADGQWLAATPVRANDEVAGLYVTGWSWARYAYRLETALRSDVQSSLSAGQSLPLLYVYLVVGESVHGAPISPDVNAKAIQDRNVLAKTKGADVYASPLSITGRQFGLAATRVPDLGKNVAIAVLRSET